VSFGVDYAIAFIMIFGLLVFLHELGHFVIAKWCRIRVQVFSLGFGPRLFGFRGPETDYRVSLIPLGGYVKMLGEETEMELVADPRDRAHDGAGVQTGEGVDEGIPPEDAFSSKPRWQRFLVMVAGGIMNVVLAVVIVAGMNLVGRREPAFLHQAPRVAGVADGSPAERAGFQRGDRIVAVDGEAVTAWAEFQQQVLFNPGRTLTVTMERGTGRVDLPVVVTLPPEDAPQHRYRIGYVGVTELAFDVQVWRVLEDSAAQRAGVQAGDILVAIDGEPILTSKDVARLISARPQAETRLRLRRGDEILTLTAVPEDREGKGLLGVDTGPTVIVRELGLVEACVESLRLNVERVQLFFTVVGKLLTGGLSVRAISGPVDIFIFSGQALRQGWYEYLDLMALFSLQLGILNLLPIPFLDGGHIAILAIEGIRRRDLSARLKERLLQVGFVALILLMGVVLFSDIVKNFDIFGRLFE
jgi:regulator of sigma E protease